MLYVLVLSGVSCSDPTDVAVRQAVEELVLLSAVDDSNTQDGSCIGLVSR